VYFFQIYTGNFFGLSKVSIPFITTTPKDANGILLLVSIWTSLISIRDGRAAHIHIDGYHTQYSADIGLFA